MKKRLNNGIHSHRGFTSFIKVNCEKETCVCVPINKQKASESLKGKEVDLHLRISLASLFVLDHLDDL